MTTTMSPANRQAFLQALRDDPVFREEARALLLTPELLKLPEQMAALTERVAALTERVDQFILAQEAFNADQREFNAAQREFNAAQREFNAAQQEFNAAQQEFNADQRELNRKVEIRLSNLEGQVANLTTQVGHLQGSDLEFRVQGSIHSIIYRRLKFRGAQILKSRSVPPSQSFHNFLYDAVDRNLIADDDIEQILAADLLLRARLPDSTEQVHVAVEVSRTVANDDITRARERADLLATAAGTQGRAVVIGTFIPEPQRERADALGVAIFQED